MADESKNGPPIVAFAEAVAGDLTPWQRTVLAELSRGSRHFYAGRNFRSHPADRLAIKLQLLSASRALVVTQKERP